MKKILSVIGGVCVSTLIFANSVSGGSELSTRQIMINNIIAPTNPWSVGIQGFVTPNPYCNTKTVSWLLPAIIYRSPKFTFYDTYGRYELFRTHYTGMEIVGQLFPMSYNSKYGDSPAMQQLSNRYMSIMVGLEERVITHYGLFAISGQNDITGNSNGFMSKLKYEMPLFFGTTENTLLVKPEFGLLYDSQNLNNYYFGISSSEGRSSGLSPYSATDSVGPYEAISVVYTASQRVNLFLVFQLYQLPNAVFNSPIEEKSKSVLSSQALVIYSF